MQIILQPGIQGEVIVAINQSGKQRLIATIQDLCRISAFHDLFRLSHQENALSLNQDRPPVNRRIPGSINQQSPSYESLPHIHSCGHLFTRSSIAAQVTKELFNANPLWQALKGSSSSYGHILLAHYPLVKIEPIVHLTGTTQSSGFVILSVTLINSDESAFSIPNERAERKYW